MEQAFQTDGPGKHLVKAVVAGGNAAGVLLKSRPLQQRLQSQPQGNLDHHAGGADPLADINDRFHLRRDVAHLVRGHGDMDVLLQRRAGVEGDPVDVGDAELLQLGNGLPGHGLGHVDKQHLAACGQLLQLPQFAPPEGYLDRHGLAVQRDVLGQLLRGTIGIRGGYKQIRPFQNACGAAVQHGKDGNIRHIGKQPGDVLAVGLACPGV